MLVQAPAEPIRVRPIRINDSTTPAALTLRVITGARRYTIPAGLLSICHQVGEALVPVLMGLAIERAVTTGDLGQLLLWLSLLAADFAMLSFSWRFGSRIGELGMLAVQHRLRSTVTEHLLKPAAAGGRRTPGEVRASDQPGVALSLATSDVNRLSHAVGIGMYPVGQFAAVIFGGIILLVIAWPLGLTVLLGAPLLLWFTDRAGGPLRTRSGHEQATAAAAAGQAADLMAGYRVIRGIGAEQEASVRYRRSSRTALASTLGARRAEGIFAGSMDLVTGLFITGVAVAAGLLALSGELGLGELITVIGLTQFLIAPLQGFARIAGTLWASGTASAERLLTLLRQDDGTGIPAGSIVPAPSPAGPGAPAGIINEVAAGEIIAVAADGRDSHDFLAALRREHPAALVVPHAAHLFAGTVRDNVALPGIPAPRVHAALVAAGCDELITTLPDGYDTSVGENGSALSGGQRQRIALARALAQDAAVLVLHDPTTAVDAVTEAGIAERLRALRGDRRTVIVTRSPALLAIADRVVFPAPPRPGTIGEDSDA